jgi:hypothetical protein
VASGQLQPAALDNVRGHLFGGVNFLLINSNDYAGPLRQWDIHSPQKGRN